MPLVRRWGVHLGRAVGLSARSILLELIDHLAFLIKLPAEQHTRINRGERRASVVSVAHGMWGDRRSACAEVHAGWANGAEPWGRGGIACGNGREKGIQHDTLPRQRIRGATAKRHARTGPTAATRHATCRPRACMQHAHMQHAHRKLQREAKVNELDGAGIARIEHDIL